MTRQVFGNKPETIIYKEANTSKEVNRVLLGTILDVVQEKGAWLEVNARGRGASGWVKKTHVRDTPIFKTFFVDVGQGDGAIIESPEGVMLVDGGPYSNFYRFLTHRYRNLIKDDNKVHINAIVVSHPDHDHFNGLTDVINDKRFTIGNIYHNGIIRYDDDNMPDHTDFNLGTKKNKVINGNTQEVLTETFSTLEQAQKLIDEGHLMSSFDNFWQAAIYAKEQGRLTGNARRITNRDKTLPGYSDQEDDKLYVEVLGPVPTKSSGRIEYVGFPPAANIAKNNPASKSSYTRNGHSIVLRLQYGKHSVLLGGDLNIPAQLHLMEYYGDENPFRVDVAKACHHGSSDFLVDFSKATKPHANVFSSGDNKSFDHPMADAVGSLGQHTRGSHPLLFSTELARAVSSTGIHYGLINLRSNGSTLVMAQMKEQKGKPDIWDSFTVPWKGKYYKQLQDYKNK